MYVYISNCDLPSCILRNLILTRLSELNNSILIYKNFRPREFQQRWYIRSGYHFTELRVFPKNMYVRFGNTVFKQTYVTHNAERVSGSCATPGDWDEILFRAGGLADISSPLNDCLRWRFTASSVRFF